MNTALIHTPQRYRTIVGFQTKNPLSVLYMALTWGGKFKVVGEYRRLP